MSPRTRSRVIGIIAHLRRRFARIPLSVARFAPLVAMLLGVGLAGVSRIHAAESVGLSSLDLSKTVQGWGNAQADKSVTGKPMSIGGVKFQHGLGTHAQGGLAIQLDRGATLFTASIGIDDAAGGGSVIFAIVGDGRLLWKSRILRFGHAPVPVRVDLTGVQNLLLLVGDAGNGNGCDHANWAEARFDIAGARPHSVTFPADRATVFAHVAPTTEYPVVLTPKPPAQPRINGARVFGVRPGHPLLFTIPATGTRPLEYAAEGLPEGLRLDPRSGQITGSIANRGRYAVTFRVKNPLGEAARKFTIVCGNTIALTPHMGWNSWYQLGDKVSDDAIRKAADAMVSSGLIDHGYMYVNIDDCWAVKPGATDKTFAGRPRDAQGNVQPTSRFPNMKALTDYIHSKGLKAGIYTSPGPVTCANCVGAYGHEAQDARQFAAWGFDFLKYDWCSYGQVAGGDSRAQLRKPYALMWDELEKQDRDIVLNLCQYGMGNVWEWGREVGNSWRTAGDLGGGLDYMPSAMDRDVFELFGRNVLQKYCGPGAWNDPDYLSLGYFWEGAPSPLAPNEQYAHMSLWCLLAAPLILGGDITRLDQFTLGLLSNDEVIEIDQDPLGKAALRVVRVQGAEVWAKDMEDGSKAVGLFNRGEEDRSITVKWSDIGIRGRQTVRDVWRQQDLGEFTDTFSTPVGWHGVVLLRIRPSQQKRG